MPVLFAGRSSGIWTGAAPNSNDVLAIQAGSPRNGTEVIFSFHLPLGLLFQPHPMISLAARTGYRLVVNYTTDTIGTTKVLAHDFPLTLELIVAIGHAVDLGFTAWFLGALHTNTTFSVNGLGSGSTSNDVSSHWGDLQRYDFWIAFRL